MVISIRLSQVYLYPVFREYLFALPAAGYYDARPAGRCTTGSSHWSHFTEAQRSWTSQCNNAMGTAPIGPSGLEKKANPEL